MIVILFSNSHLDTQLFKCVAMTTSLEEEICWLHKGHCMKWKDIINNLLLEIQPEYLFSIFFVALLIFLIFCAFFCLLGFFLYPSVKISWGSQPQKKKKKGLIFSFLIGVDYESTHCLVSRVFLIFFNCSTKCPMSK